MSTRYCWRMVVRIEAQIREQGPPLPRIAAAHTLAPRKSWSLYLVEAGRDEIHDRRVLFADGQRDEIGPKVPRLRELTAVDVDRRRRPVRRDVDRAAVPHFLK